MDTVTMAHGSGGTAMHELIQNVFMRNYGTVPLLESGDAAVMPTPRPEDGNRLALTTDSYVVTPRFFPGGDIGRLAICGTVNDLATAGAAPHYLSAGFILEEGFALQDLATICRSMARASEEAGIMIVTGDTKVVPRGQGDGVYINTTGVGFIAPGIILGAENCQIGDRILLSGTLGDHGIAVISQREGLSFTTTILSDVAPLYALCEAVLKAAPATRAFRDPTRGGLASTLTELADKSRTAMVVQEEAVPVRDEVRGACDLLGYDIYQVANEGKMVAIVAAEQAEAALEAMREAPYGENAAIIGEVCALATGTDKPQAYVQTAFGSKRIMDVLSGEQLPRIC